MANKTFSDFTNQATPLGSDYVVGYRGTSEQRYTLSVISGLIAAGGGGLTSPLTTVGDIWGYDGADARIPVGANGEVLVADSTQALGVKWGATGASSSLWASGENGIYPNQAGTERSIILGNNVMGGLKALVSEHTNLSIGNDYAINTPAMVISGNNGGIEMRGKDWGSTIPPRITMKSTGANGDYRSCSIVSNDGSEADPGNWYGFAFNSPETVPITLNAGQGNTFLTVNSISGAAYNATYGVMGGQNQGAKTSANIGDGRVLVLRQTGLGPVGPNIVIENTYNTDGTRGIVYTNDASRSAYASWMHGVVDSDNTFRICSKGTTGVSLEAGARFVISSGGNITPGSNSLQNFGSSSKAWGTGYFSKAGGGNAGTIVLGNTKIESDAYGIEIYQAPGVGGGLGNISGSTGRFADLYVNGTRITGGGGGGDSSPLTTKGDLYGFTTENARIGTGVNGQVLTVDSTEAAGVAWADSAAGCPVTSWTEAFEEDADGNLTPVTSNCVNDTMWMLNSDNSLSLRSNHFRYNWGAGAFTEDVSF